MTQIAPPEIQFFDATYRPPLQEAPECTDVCRADAYVAGRINIHGMLVSGPYHVWDPVTRERRIFVAVNGWAFWSYFDQYGCAISGLSVDPRFDSPIASFIKFPGFDDPSQREKIWTFTDEQLALQGAPKPGTIELVGPFSGRFDRAARERVVE